MPMITGRSIGSIKVRRQYAKGEGASQMVADFVSADYGWSKSPDGQQHAHVLFKAGKAHEGYFTNEDILNHTSAAMDILKTHYPDESHVLIFDKWHYTSSMS
jgi:hypothetical protein